MKSTHSGKRISDILKSPSQTVTELFVATDQRKWEEVKQHFASEVLLDYASMTGNSAETLSPDQIVTAWKGILPGFEYTHHQLGNLLTKTAEQQATVFCYGTASHYVADEGGNLWTVVGSYDFDLVKSSDGTWRITSMTFHFKYQDGNTVLPQKAIDHLK